MRREEKPLLFGRETRRIHCLGVGGAGVAPLALYLSQAGFELSGEDDALAPEVADLLVAGGVTLGPMPSPCDLVARSSAVRPNHPAYAAAVAAGIPVVRRGELLAEVVRGKKLVAVCGAHGKTTTAAMIATAVKEARFPAGFLIGGLFGDGSPPARLGSNDWVIAEIDESDGTIEQFSPEITVATNLDWDHPDHYRDPAAFEAAFSALFGRTRGTVLVSDACARSLRLAPEAATFGKSGSFAATIVAETPPFMTVRLSGRFAPREVTVHAGGEFNAANAGAALAAVQLMGVPVEAGLLAEYPGTRRRQSVLFSDHGLQVIEDYAHHPTEIRALLSSLRKRAKGSLIVVFQPHRFSRTKQFKREFAAALALADSIHLIDVYSAGESPIAGGTSADVYAELQGMAVARSSYLPGDEALYRALLKEARPGDTVAFVGAGDIDRKAREWIALLRSKAAAAAKWDEFAADLKVGLSPGAKLKREEPLAGKTTIRIGGAARLYAEPASVADLKALVAGALLFKIPVHVLGRGSNLIIPDDGVDGLVIALFGEAWSAFEPLADGRLRVGAGLRLKNLCGLATKAGLVGFEFLEGIPGSVGGALKMNAGAMGGWMFDVVEKVEFLTKDGEVRMMDKSLMHIDYRHCEELQDAVAIAAILRPASSAEGAQIAAKIDGYRKKRHESQPREPSAGCIFKNPPGTSAGRLIDESGLKGERVGDAEVSAVHANFIINRGQATGEDILELVRRIRQRVRQRTGIDLEPEVLLYGKQWKDLL